MWVFTRCVCGRDFHFTLLFRLYFRWWWADSFNLLNGKRGGLDARVACDAGGAESGSGARFARYTGRGGGVANVMRVGGGGGIVHYIEHFVFDILKGFAAVVGLQQHTKAGTAFGGRPLKLTFETLLCSH